MTIFADVLPNQMPQPLLTGLNPESCAISFMIRLEIIHEGRQTPASVTEELPEPLA